MKEKNKEFLKRFYEETKDGKNMDKFFEERKSIFKKIIDKYVKRERN